MATASRPTVLLNETSQASATTGTVTMTLSTEFGGLSICAKSTVGGTLEIERLRASDGTTWDPLPIGATASDFSAPLVANELAVFVLEWNPWTIRAKFTPDSSGDFFVEALAHD